MEIENGEVDYNTHILTSVLRYPVNTVVSFSCDAGYYSSYYFNSATCQNSGNWSKQAPMCLGNENEPLSSMLLVFKCFKPLIPQFWTSGSPYSSGFQS